MHTSKQNCQYSGGTARPASDVGLAHIHDGASVQLNPSIPLQNPTSFYTWRPKTPRPSRQVSATTCPKDTELRRQTGDRSAVHWAHLAGVTGTWLGKGGGDAAPSWPCPSAESPVPQSVPILCPLALSDMFVRRAAVSSRDTRAVAAEKLQLPKCRLAKTQREFAYIAASSYGLFSSEPTAAKALCWKPTPGL